MRVPAVVSLESLASDSSCSSSPSPILARPSCCPDTPACSWSVSSRVSVWFAIQTFLRVLLLSERCFGSRISSCSCQRKRYRNGRVLVLKLDYGRRWRDRERLSVRRASSDRFRHLLRFSCSLVVFRSQTASFVRVCPSRRSL